MEHFRRYRFSEGSHWKRALRGWKETLTMSIALFLQWFSNISNTGGSEAPFTLFGHFVNLAAACKPCWDATSVKCGGKVLGWDRGKKFYFDSQKFNCGLLSPFKKKKPLNSLWQLLGLVSGFSLLNSKVKKSETNGRTFPITLCRMSWSDLKNSAVGICSGWVSTVCRVVEITFFNGVVINWYIQYWIPI